MSQLIENHRPSSYANEYLQTVHEYNHAIQVPPTQKGECDHSIFPSCTGAQQGACLHNTIWGYLETVDIAPSNLQVPNTRCESVHHATKPPRAKLKAVPGSELHYYYPTSKAIDRPISLKLDPTGPKKRRVYLRNGPGK